MINAYVEDRIMGKSFQIKYGRKTANFNVTLDSTLFNTFHCFEIAHNYVWDKI